jgi:hypothetical protein
VLEETWKECELSGRDIDVFKEEEEEEEERHGRVD